MNYNYFNGVGGGQFENLCVARVFLNDVVSGSCLSFLFIRRQHSCFCALLSNIVPSHTKKTEEFSANLNY